MEIFSGGIFSPRKKANSVELKQGKVVNSPGQRINKKTCTATYCFLQHRVSVGRMRSKIQQGKSSMTETIRADLLEAYLETENGTTFIKSRIPKRECPVCILKCSE